MGNAGITRGRIQARLVGLAGLDRPLHRVVDLQDRELGAIGAVLLNVLLLDDRKGLHDVIGVVAVDAVEVEEGGVEFAAKKEAAGLVPSERRAMVTTIACERSEIPGSKGQFDTEQEIRASCERLERATRGIVDPHVSFQVDF